MKRRILIAFAAITVVAASILVFAQNRKQIKEFLTGYEEVPAVSTAAGAVFRAKISRDESQITYELTYNDLEGTVTQSHIHFGQAGVNGSIEMWLCGNPPLTPPAGTQPCPDPPATITGTLTAANVVGQPAGPPAGQGIQAGEFAEVIRAMRAGKTYVNVHSTKFPGGEIRSQIDADDDHDHHGFGDEKTNDVPN